MPELSGKLKRQDFCPALLWQTSRAPHSASPRPKRIEKNKRSRFLKIFMKTVRLVQCGRGSGSVLTSLFNNLKNIALNILHNKIRPEMGVKIKAGGKTVGAREMEDGFFGGKRLDGVSPPKDVEIRPAHFDVGIQG